MCWDHGVLMWGLVSGLGFVVISINGGNPISTLICCSHYCVDSQNGIPTFREAPHGNLGFRVKLLGFRLDG